MQVKQGYEKRFTLKKFPPPRWYSDGVCGTRDYPAYVTLKLIRELLQGFDASTQSSDAVLPLD